MKNNIFQEFTLINPETQTEVMVNISVNTGKVLNLYCYAKDIPVIYRNEETENKYNISTKPSKNTLFVHIQQKAKVFSLLLNNGFICLINEEDELYNEDTAIFEKCLSLYNINVSNLY